MRSEGSDSNEAASGLAGAPGAMAAQPCMVGKKLPVMLLHTSLEAAEVLDHEVPPFTLAHAVPPCTYGAGGRFAPCAS
jgi:hypothetical protein